MRFPIRAPSRNFLLCFVISHSSWWRGNRNKVTSPSREIRFAFSLSSLFRTKTLRSADSPPPGVFGKVNDFLSGARFSSSSFHPVATAFFYLRFFPIVSGITDLALSTFSRPPSTYQIPMESLLQPRAFFSPGRSPIGPRFLPSAEPSFSLAATFLSKV